MTSYNGASIPWRRRESSDEIRETAQFPRVLTVLFSPVLIGGAFYRAVGPFESREEYRATAGRSTFGIGKRIPAVPGLFGLDCSHCLFLRSRCTEAD